MGNLVGVWESDCVFRQSASGAAPAEPGHKPCSAAPKGSRSRRSGAAAGLGDRSESAASRVWPRQGDYTAPSGASATKAGG